MKTGMVDTIIRITAALVTLVAAANMVHGVILGGRLVRHVARRYGHLGLWLWLPAWRSGREARQWLATWRGILTAGDPIVAAIRVDGHAVVARHVQLLVSSQMWAMAVALLPRLV